MEGIDIEDIDDDIEYFVELTNIAGETCKVPVTADDPVTHSLLPKVRMELKQKTSPVNQPNVEGHSALRMGCISNAHRRRSVCAPPSIFADLNTLL